MTGTWEHFAHGADIGVRGRGSSVELAFEATAEALVAVIADPNAIAARDPVEITCDAPDRELLLVAWLDAVVFEIATRRMLFRRFAVRIDGNRLQATAWGEPIDPARHHPAVEVKGATLTSLGATRSDDGTWVAETVVDV